MTWATSGGPDFTKFDHAEQFDRDHLRAGIVGALAMMAKAEAAMRTEAGKAKARGIADWLLVQMTEVDDGQ